MQQRRSEDDPFFVLNNGLNPQIADVLSRFGFPIRSVQLEFGVAPTDSVSDEEIIDHIADQYGFRGVWITKDTSAKRVHMEQIKARQISMIWIHRQNLSTIQQLRILMHRLTHVYQDLKDSRAPVHYRVEFHGQENKETITYKVEWTGRRQRS